MIHQYLARLQATVDSRQEIQVERFDVRQLSVLDGRIAGLLRFYDGSILEFREAFRIHDQEIKKHVSPAPTPDLSEVPGEIDSYLYPSD